MMSFNLTIDEVFSWNLSLTAQQDFQALTHSFLEILHSVPGIEKAIAYEIHNNDKKRTGEAGTIQEQLITRFPVNFNEESNETFNSIFNFSEHREGLSLSTISPTGAYSRAILSISNGNGPDRAVILEGRFNQMVLSLLANLRKLYSNLLLLHDAKERDALTRLLNRQSLDSRLSQVCEHYYSYPVVDKISEQSSWIAILDIDHFKRINDNFGHLYGDEVLLIFSQIMAKNFRYNDFLFRFGGEEFVVILNLATQGLAEATFNRFRSAVADYDFPTVGKVTVSIGLTHVDSKSIPSVLLDRADKALYYAKSTGRNNVVMYEDMPSLPHSGTN